MRKILYIAGGVALALVVVVAGAIGFVAYKGNGLDAESKAFVDRAIPAIVMGWKQDQLLTRATGELRQSATPAQITGMFETLSRLGPLVEYQGAQGQATMTYFTGKGTIVSANYIATALFKNGRATFRVVLLKRDGHWFIHNFHVDPVFGANPAKET